MVSRSFGWRRLSSLAAEFRGVDVGESNSFAFCGRARIAVVAGGDHNGCTSSNEQLTIFLNEVLSADRHLLSVGAQTPVNP